MSKEGGDMELVAVNPVMVLGPILGQDDSTSIELVKKLLQGALPGYPHLSFGVVDVRDIADLHFRAMTNPAAKGERFLAIAGGFITMKEIGEVLKRNLGVPAKKVPSREIPDWLVKLVAFVDPSIRQVVPELGKNKNATNEKARQLLNWNPRSPEEAILATAESLLKFGMINK
jgi:dihydroflavonol-4-reductase